MFTFTKRGSKKDDSTFSCYLFKESRSAINFKPKQ